MKNIKKLFSVLMVGVLTLGICACGSSSGSTNGGTGSSGASEASSETTTIDVILDWYPNAIHTFLYDAVAYGYFEEEGLTVNIISPAESVDAISFVATEKAQIGLTYPVDIINAVENDMPVQALAAVSQKPLECLCSLAENTDITEDMSSVRGKKVGYAGTAVAEANVRTIMRSAGLEDSDYELINVGFDLVTSLTTGSVDLVAGTFINDEIVTMRLAGYSVNVYSEQDYGVPDTYGLVMAVNSEDYEARPEIYEAFLRACDKGFDDMAEDKTRSLQIIMSEMHSDTNPLNEDQQAESYDILIELMETDEGAFLSMDQAKWQEMIDWMMDYGLLEKDLSVEDVIIE